MATWPPSGAVNEGADRKVTNDHILPYVQAADASGDVAKALNTLPFERNIFKLLANAPNYMPQYMAFLARNFAPTKALLPSEWQTTVLTTSVALNAPYEYDVNAPVAQLLPHWPSEKFAAIRSRDFSSSKLFTKREQLIGATVLEIANAERASRQTMETLKQHFNAAEITEIFIVHGTYALLARFMNSAQIDFDPPIDNLDGMLAKTFAADIERQKKADAQQDGA